MYFKGVSMEYTYKIREGGTIEFQTITGFDSLLNTLNDLPADKTYAVSIINSSEFSMVGNPKSIIKALTNIVNDACSIDHKKTMLSDFHQDANQKIR